MNAPGENVYTMAGLAQNWTTNNDRTEWTFTLREGLTFHDGSKITAEDIEYSLRAAITYGDWRGGPYMDNTSDPAFNYFFNITYQSPDTLTFTISSTNHDYSMLPDPMFEWDFSGAFELYAIVPKNCFETNNSRESFRKQPISAGPYMIASPEDIIEGESYLLTRFDDWFDWGQTFTASNGQQYTFPTVDKAFKYVKFIVIEDSDSRLIQLTSKDLDAIVTGGNFDLPNRKAIDTLNARSEFNVQEFKQLGGSILQPNIQGDWPQIFGGPGNFPVSESWFRKAISHAINRTRIVEEVFKGVGSAWNSFYPEWILEMYPNLITDSYYDFSFNIDKAKEILETNGYPPLGFSDEPDNRFGWGLYANETAIDSVEQTKGRHFILLTPETLLNLGRAVEIRNLLRNIGIYVNLEVPTFEESQKRKYCTAGRYYNKTGPQPDPKYQGVDWDFYLLGWCGEYDIPSRALPYFSFALWYHLWYTYGPQGWGYYGWGSHGWFNEEYETARSKIEGGEPGWLGRTLWDFMDPPLDMPEGVMLFLNGVTMILNLSKVVPLQGNHYLMNYL
jgi:ABC-type transport system substrate-binding protein